MKNKKGFTMVELLATITILGVLMTIAIGSISLILRKGRENYYTSQRNNLIAAAKSYYQSNRSELPKNINEKKTVTLETLQKGNFIDKVYDAQKKECVKGETDETFVSVILTSKNKYKYTSHLYCPGQKDKTITGAGTVVTAEYTKEDKLVTLNVNSSDTKIKSYTYDVSKNDMHYVGPISGTGDNKTLNLKPFEIDLNDRLQTNKFTASIRVIDEYNNSYTASVEINVNDNTAPTCIVDTSNLPPWSAGPQTITAKCVDSGDGYVSGCEKEIYRVKLKNKNDVPRFKNLKMKDKAGNVYNCSLEPAIRIDTIPPVITFDAPGDGYTINVTATDNETGVVAHHWQNENTINVTARKQVTNSKSLGTLYGSNIYYYATDAAGNSSSNYHATYKWCNQTVLNGIMPTWAAVEAANNQGVWTGLPIFKFKYNSKDCDINRDSGPVRIYDYWEYGCQCSLDAHSRKYCSYVNVGDFTTATHSSAKAKIYYHKTAEGVKACNGDYNVNSYVRLVCRTGYTSNTPLFFHGYYFYSGAVGPYNDFNPSKYWFNWIPSNPSNRISSDYDVVTACTHACQVAYGLHS